MATAKLKLLTALALCASLSPAGAQVPLPPERPPEIAPAVPVSPAPDAAAAPPTAPLPPERPGDIGRPDAPKPDASKPDALKPAAAAEVPPASAARDDTACRGRLDRLGVKWEALPPIADGLCGTPRPLRVSAISEGVALAPAITTTCPVAESLARWATEVRVVAERELGHPPKGYRIGGSYECRGQNHDAEAKLSDHAHAAAVDVMGFEMEGRAPLIVGALPEGTPEARTLGSIRAIACEMFSTVLGPGTDAEHANHLHLDLRERPKGYRICQ